MTRRRTALFGDSDALPVNAASRKLSQLVVPRCTYTEPEVASCGVSNAAGAQRWDNVGKRGHGGDHGSYPLVNVYRKLWNITILNM